MMALAFGPGRAVLMSGAFITVASYQCPAGLFAFPARACGGVLEQDPARVEILSNSIGFGEVPARARRAPRRDELLDFLHGHRRTLVLRATQRQDPEHAIERVERLTHGGHVPRAHLAG